MSALSKATGGQGYAAGAPYDCAIFTAGTYDLPQYFYQQIKNAGLLLVVIKNEGGGDCLFLMQKTGDHFESIEAIPCAFVQMTGQYRIESLEPICLEQSPEWPDLNSRKLEKSPFWWGGKGNESFAWRTWGIRSFLGIVEPLFQIFKTGKVPGSPFDEQYFGLWDRSRESLVISRDDTLISYGNPAARDRLMQDIGQWLRLGMPTIASFTLQIYPSGSRVQARENQWLVKRNESRFLWSLPT